MKIILATRNKNKIREIEMILSKDRIIPIEEIIPEYSSPLETGKSLYENAKIKAISACLDLTCNPERRDALFGALVLAEDSGLFINALDGRPGVYSARVSEDKTAFVLDNLKNEMDRAAEYRCGLYMMNVLRDTEVYIESICKGTITETRRGIGWDYDPIFQPLGSMLTFGEMTQEQKNKISHRAKALLAMKILME